MPPRKAPKKKNTKAKVEAPKKAEMSEADSLIENSSQVATRDQEIAELKGELKNSVSKKEHQELLAKHETLSQEYDRLKGAEVKMKQTIKPVTGAGRQSALKEDLVSVFKLDGRMVSGAMPRARAENLVRQTMVNGVATITIEQQHGKS